MGAVYLYAEDSAHYKMPPELEMLRFVDRFGWATVQQAPRSTLRRMIAAENVVKAYHSKKASEGEGKEGWVAWQQNNPQSNQLLARARQAAEELDDDSDG
jgi:hypothetical protein